MNFTGPCVRGCGTRDKGATYLCCGRSIGGKDIEYFVIDPVRMWPGDFQRGFKIMPTVFGYNHVVIFVGASFYASPWDFVEECRHFGASRKVAPTFPFEQLTPGKSRMIFVHPSCYVPESNFPFFEVELPSPLDKHCCFNGYDWGDYNEYKSGWHPSEEKITHCTFNHKNLSFYFHFDDDDPKTHARKDDTFEVQMPSFSYEGKIPDCPGDVYANP